MRWNQLELITKPVALFNMQGGKWIKELRENKF